MSRVVEVITLTADQVRHLIGEAVAKALADRRALGDADSVGLSASAAARRAGCRDGYLLSALRRGGLHGRRHGNRWVISAGELRRWIEAGRPESE